MFFLDYFKKKDYKKVLSLDGGGVRGLASVIFLKQLEKETGKTVFELFDFFIENTALETKTTTRNDRKHIFSYDQLNSKNLKIIVCSIKLEKQRSGLSILDLKKKIEKKIKNKDLLKKLNEN